VREPHPAGTIGYTASILLIFIDILIGLLLIVSLAAVVTVFLHIWTGVPYVPTPQPVVDAMVKAANIRKGETVVDLGAGDCRLLIAAKRRYPSIRAWGCELVPTIWILGKIRIWLSRQDVDLRLGEAFLQDVSGADVIFLYLMPEVLRKLEPRFDALLKPGTRVISHAFRFAKREPVRTLKIPSVFHEKTVLVYAWAPRPSSSSAGRAGGRKRSARSSRE
jgi:hypothetical protein